MYRPINDPLLLSNKTGFKDSRKIKIYIPDWNETPYSGYTLKNGMMKISFKIYFKIKMLMNIILIVLYNIINAMHISY